MLGAGQRDRKVTFYPRVFAEDAQGVETESDGTGVPAFASVRFGTSAERREAGAQAAVQSATFRVLSTAALRAADGTWQIEFDGSRWGVAGKPAQAGSQGRELEFTAVRKGD